MADMTPAEKAAREIAESRIKKLMEVLAVSDRFRKFLLDDESLSEHAEIITRHFAPLVEAGDHLTAIIGGNFNALDDYDEAHAALAAWTAAKDATP
jgi:hypothetical protein